MKGLYRVVIITPVGFSRMVAAHARTATQLASSERLAVADPPQASQRRIRFKR